MGKISFCFVCCCWFFRNDFVFLGLFNGSFTKGSKTQVKEKECEEKEENEKYQEEV